MTLPEIRPIRTSEVVLFEAVPVAAAEPGADPGVEWRVVRAAGSRLTVGVRFLDYLEAREVHQLEDVGARIDLIMKHAFRSAQIGSEVLPGEQVIPLIPRAELALKVLKLSTSGVDPFAEAPAAS